MSDFKAKMHQNRFRLGLRPTPRWGSLRRFPKPLSRLGGDRLLGRLHFRAFGTPLDLPYHLYVRGPPLFAFTVLTAQNLVS